MVLMSGPCPLPGAARYDETEANCKTFPWPASDRRSKPSRRTPHDQDDPSYSFARWRGRRRDAVGVARAAAQVRIQALGGRQPADPALRRRVPVGRAGHAAHQRPHQREGLSGLAARRRRPDPRARRDAPGHHRLHRLLDDQPLAAGQGDDALLDAVPDAEPQGVRRADQRRGRARTCSRCMATARRGAARLGRERFPRAVELQAHRAQAGRSQGHEDPLRGRTDLRRRLQRARRQPAADELRRPAAGALDRRGRRAGEPDQPVPRVQDGHAGAEAPDDLELLRRRRHLPRREAGVGHVLQGGSGDHHRVREGSRASGRWRPRARASASMATRPRSKR